MISWFLNLFRKKATLSLDEYKKDLRHYTKNQLILMIIKTAQDMNYNRNGVEVEFRRALRKHSKRILIKTLTNLKLYENKKVRKHIEKIAKAKVDASTVGI